MNLYRISMQEGTRKALQIFRKALIRINKGKAPTGLNSDPPPLLKVFQINPISFLTMLPCRWHHQIFVFLSVWWCHVITLVLDFRQRVVAFASGMVGENTVFFFKKSAIKWQKFYQLVFPVLLSVQFLCFVFLLRFFFFSCLDLMGISGYFRG